MTKFIVNKRKFSLVVCQVRWAWMELLNALKPRQIHLSALLLLDCLVGRITFHDYAFRRLFINVLALESLNLLTRSLMFSREFCLDCDSDVTSPPIAAAAPEDRDEEFFKWFTRNWV